MNIVQFIKNIFGKLNPFKKPISVAAPQPELPDEEKLKELRTKTLERTAHYQAIHDEQYAKEVRKHFPDAPANIVLNERGEKSPAPNRELSEDVYFSTAARALMSAHDADGSEVVAEPETVVYDIGFDEPRILEKCKYQTSPRIPVVHETPLQKPSFNQRPPKKQTRSEKKREKAQRQKENLSLKRDATPPKEEIRNEASPRFMGVKSIKEMIADLDPNNQAPKLAAQGRIKATDRAGIPDVSTVMGEDFGGEFQWEHKDDQFIDFKILTRIVVSDPVFFSKYILRTLDQEELQLYKADFFECFAPIEALLPVVDLSALAIMDEGHYCILVAWRNVFGMIIVNEDDAIDMKRRGTGLNDDHPTGFYHMSFMRFDPEALHRMDLVGRNEYGYAEQIPHFTVNFAKFDHSTDE